VKAKITLKTMLSNEILRLDCARASMCYHFYVVQEDGQHVTGPEVYVVARIKPKTHHYKAGNINNCIFNERIEGEFVSFFDNDMKPKEDFLNRTVPWFFSYSDVKKR
jgi:cellulose synthase/poly-beta-1,6-N-acetylglucosamine synthase-like glycosyltransferase